MCVILFLLFIFFFQVEDGIRDIGVTGVQTCALPICFLLTDALHWESGRVIQTWSYALASEVFHEKGPSRYVVWSHQGQGGSGHTPLPLELREPCRWSNAHLPQSRNPKDIRLPRGRKPTVRSAERSTGRHCAPCSNYASDILPRANPAMKYWRC